MAFLVACRLKQFDESPPGERAHPTVFRDGLALVVIAFDDDDRNPRVFQSLKPGDGMIHSLRINIAPVEEITRDKDEINLVRDSMIFNNVVPRAEKIFRALFQVIATAAQMYVRQM